MPYYLVYAHRTTEYRVKADNEEDAIDKMIDGEGEETDGTTNHIRVELDDDQTATKRQKRTGRNLSRQR